MKIASAVRLAKALRKARLHNKEFHNGSSIARPLPDHGYGALDAWHYDVICLACTPVRGCTLQVPCIRTGTCDEPEHTTEPDEDTWESLGRGIIDFPEPDQTYGAEGG